MRNADNEEDNNSFKLNVRNNNNNNDDVDDAYDEGRLEVIMWGK